MTVGELKYLLEGVDDDTQVLIPLNAGDGFDGMFFSPCIEESGIGEMPLGEDEEDFDPVFNPEPTEQTFLLVPHGFFEIIEDEIDPQMN